MVIRSQQHFGNLLIRRLSRHTRMATLFRFTEPYSPSNWQSRISRYSTNEETPLVRAALFPIAPELPWGAALDSEPVEEAPTSQRPLKELNRRQMEAPQPNVAVQEVPANKPSAPLSPVQHQATVPMQPQARPAFQQPIRREGDRPFQAPAQQPAPPPQAPPPATPPSAAPIQTSPTRTPNPSSGEQGIDDKTWNRLEAIYHAHQEKNRREREAVEERVRQRRAANVPSTHQSSPVQKQPLPAQTSSPAAIPAPISPQATHPDPEITSTPTIDINPEGSPAIISRAPATISPKLEPTEAQSVEEPVNEPSPATPVRPAPASANVQDSPAEPSRTSALQSAWQRFQNIIRHPTESEPPPETSPEKPLSVVESQPQIDQGPAIERQAVTSSEPVAFQPVREDQPPGTQAPSADLPSAQPPETQAAYATPEETSSLIDPKTGTSTTQALTSAIPLQRRFDQASAPVDTHRQPESPFQGQPGSQPASLEPEAVPRVGQANDIPVEFPSSQEVWNDEMAAQPASVSTPASHEPTVSNQAAPTLIQPKTSGAKPTIVKQSTGEAPLPSRQLAIPASEDIPYLEPEDISEEPAQEDTQVVQQALPLEQAWSVERRDSTSQEKLSQANQPPASMPVPPLSEPDGSSLEVQRMLQAVEPGQRTDSRVEMLAPRRPRPVFPAPERYSDAEEEPAQSVAPPAEPYPVQKITVDEERPVQGSPSQVPPMNPNSNLAELWGLLDQMQAEVNEPNENQAQQASAPIPSAAVGESPTELSAPVQRAANPVRSITARQPEVSFPGLASSPASPAEPKVLQRETATSSPASPPEEPSGGETGEKVGKPDVDELARQVYAEVRRKLSVEWERMRR